MNCYIASTASSNNNQLFFKEKASILVQKMKITTALLGKGFGELAYIRGIVYYRLSPFEQKAFGGFVKSLYRTAYRINSNLLTVVPPFVLGYFIYSETEKKYAQMCRKNPDDYVNDE